MSYHVRVRGYKMEIAYGWGVKYAYTYLQLRKTLWNVHNNGNLAKHNYHNEKGDYVTDYLQSQAKRLDGKVMEERLRQWEQHVENINEITSLSDKEIADEIDQKLMRIDRLELEQLRRQRLKLHEKEEPKRNTQDAPRGNRQSAQEDSQAA